MKLSAKRLLALLLCLTLIAPFALSAFVSNVEVPAKATTQNQRNIAARADYLYGLTWTCQKNISARAYNTYYTFYAGNTYHLPYGQGDTSYYIGYGVDPEDFVAAASNVNSIFYTQKSYAGSWYSSYYIQDCSGFVSWCWGLTVKQSTRSLANYSTYIGAVTTSNIYNYLQIGDALNRYDYHVVLVTDLFYDGAGNLTGIEITEQTIPETERTVYTPSGLASAYASYDGIYRYYGSVPEAPNQVEETPTTFEGHLPVDLGDDFYAYVRQTASGNYLTNSNGNVCVTNSLVDNGTQRWHFVRQANGAYSLGIEGTPLWMDVADDSYEDGTNIRMATGDGSYNQKFYVYYIGGNFYFRAMYNHRTVDVDAASGNVQLCGSSTGLESKASNPLAWEARSFEILKIAPDYFQWHACIGWNFPCYIRNTATGKLLTADGDNAVFAEPTYEESQKWIVTRNDYGAHTIVSALTGKALDVSGESIAQGIAIDLYDANGQKNQDFFVIHAGASNYYIKPSYTDTVVSMDASTGELFSQPYGTTAAEKNAQSFEFVTDYHIDSDVVMRDAQYLGNTFRAQIIAKNNTVLTDNTDRVSMVANTYGENQYWTFTYDSVTNAYKITGSSGKVLDVYQGGWLDETMIQIDESGDVLSQRFRFYSADYGYIISPAHTQNLLGICNDDQTLLELHGSSPVVENYFNVSVASYSGKTPVDLGETFTSSIQNVASGMYVTATEEGAANGTATSSQWIFTRQANGGYTIQDAATGEVLDVAAGMVTAGTDVQLYFANGTLAQTFFIYETDGGYVFMCAGSPNVIDMAESTTELHIDPWSTTESGIAGQTFDLPEATATATKLILKTDSALSEDGTYVTNVSVGTTVSWLVGQFENDDVIVYDSNGNEVAGDAVCGTGYSVNLVKNGEIVDTLEIVATGDVDGNGEIDTTDYLRIKSMFLGSYTLEGAYFLAGDVDQNGVIDTTDYMRIRAHFLGTQDL